MIRKRVLLLTPSAGYRNQAFLAAGQALGVEITVGANYCPRLAPGWGLNPLLALPFDRPESAFEKVLRAFPAAPDAVLAVDDQGLELAATLRAHWGMQGNSPEAVRKTRDKLAFRTLLRDGGLNCPDFFQWPADSARGPGGIGLAFPVVVKPRRLSASRGVIRADDMDALIRAVAWASRIQGEADRDGGALGLMVERFIPGSEYALEGILERGRLRVLALFDKPDPLDGPFFEETIYVTPSRLPAVTQSEIAEAVQNACRLAGLREGPVHAEMRVNDKGVWLLEVAARSIGGLCGHILRHALGMSLEELILRQALGMSLPETRAGEAAGVMMIPIPRRGIYQGVHNLEAAQAVPGVTGIHITAQPGHRLAPPPEGDSYLGFIYAEADWPEAAEMALRQAQRLLAFDIQPEFPVAASPAC